MAERILTEPLVHAIGWALVHFVWQGALVAGVAALVLAALRRARATTRYVVAGVALAAMFAAPVATTVQLTAEIRIVAPGGAAAPLQVARPDVPATRDAGIERIAPASSPREYVERALPGAVMIWLAGVILLSLRLSLGWYAVGRLRRLATPLAASVQSQVAVIAERLRIARHVQVLESAAIAVPTLVGWVRPVILLPASLATGMPVSHLDAVIAHELAHVRRHDYAINALQAIVETLLFYHPAVWWVSRQVRVEREHCCDDLAVAAFGCFTSSV